MDGVLDQGIGPGKGWDQIETFDFVGFLDLGFWESSQSLMDSKVWAGEALKAAHHLILNSLAKCWGNGAVRKLWEVNSQQRIQGILN